MSTVSLEEAQARLPELINHLSAGDSLIITRSDQPVAQLTPIAALGMAVPGRCRGMLIILAEDDEHLTDFGEYMA
jgi:antitoxin (DNA-binding transcriptional repressor) of toxin-antitoxin stability system